MNGTSERDRGWLVEGSRCRETERERGREGERERENTRERISERQQGGERENGRTERETSAIGLAVNSGDTSG